MAKSYTRMNLEERKIMQNLFKKGHSFSQIPGFSDVPRRQYRENTKNLAHNKAIIVENFIR